MYNHGDVGFLWISCDAPRSPRAIEVVDNNTLEPCLVYLPVGILTTKGMLRT